MKFFDNLSIKKKLNFIILIVTFLATSIIVIVGIIEQYSKIKEDLIDSVLLNAKMTAEISISPILYVDKDASQNILSFIEILSKVKSTYIFDDDSNLFASYSSKDYKETFNPTPSDSQKIEILDGYIRVSIPIIFKDTKLGSVVMTASTQILTEQILSYSFYSFLVLIGVGFLSLVIANQLQKYISTPIIELAKTTREISTKGDYSISVNKKFSDEVGLLYDEFNELIKKLKLKEIERDKVEKIIKINEFRLKKAQEISKVGSWVWDHIEKKMIWSEEMYRIFGISNNSNNIDLLSIFNNSILPDDYNVLQQENEKLVNKDTFSEYRIIRADGSLRFIRAGGDYLIDSNDTKPKIGVVQDITQQKEIENQILLSKQRFEGIFNSAPVAIWEADFTLLTNLLEKIKNEKILDIEEYFYNNPKILTQAKKTITPIDINFASLNLFEAKSYNHLVENIENIFLPETNLSLKDMIISIYNGILNFETETKFRTIFGKTLDVIFKMNTFNDKIMQNRTLISIIDITELKKLEQARENLLSEITHKNSELEQIIYVSSHDLRSPLVNIQGFGKELELSIDEIKDIIESNENIFTIRNQLSDIIKSDIQSSLKFIRTSAIKMDNLLKGLLRISRLGRAAIRIENLDMSLMINKIIEAMQFQVLQSNVEIVIGNLPNCKGDSLLINQLFTNIIDNAVKYLSPNRKGVINIFGTQKESSVIYQIKDNGIGIHPEQREKIFEIFHRLNPDSSIAGEGLGLAIVKRILQKHNGTIWLNSEEDKGCEFFIELPFY